LILNLHSLPSKPWFSCHLSLLFKLIRIWIVSHVILVQFFLGFIYLLLVLELVSQLLNLVKFIVIKVIYVDMVSVLIDKTIQDLFESFLVCHSWLQSIRWLVFILIMNNNVGASISLPLKTFFRISLALTLIWLEKLSKLFNLLFKHVSEFLRYFLCFHHFSQKY